MSKKILIVESSEVTRKYLLESFKRLNEKYFNCVFELDSTDSYKVALEKSRELAKSKIQYSLLTLNLRADGMKPIEFLEILNTNKNIRPYHIAVITGTDKYGVKNEYNIGSELYNSLLFKPNDIIDKTFEKLKGLLSKIDLRK